MIHDLRKLSNYLDKANKKNQVAIVDAMIKESIMGPSSKKVKEYQSDESHMHTLLDLLGLVPGVGEAADMSNAILYLSEGINPSNLLMAGLSVVSMVPTLGDASKVIKYGEKLAPDVIKRIAQMIAGNKSKIISILSNFKSPKYAAHISSYIPNGKLLVQYADRIKSALFDWVHKILQAEVKAPIAETIQS